MNLPNLLTILRILLTPILIILILQKRLDLATGLFSIAALTDALDGLIARQFNQKTKTGAILDPVADKFLLTSAYLTLSAIDFLPQWLTILVISRDVIIVAGIIILFLFQNGVEIRPSIISKATTVFQLLTILLVMAHNHLGIITNCIQLVYWITAGLTVISGLHYMTVGVTLLNKGSNTGQ